MSKEQSIEEAYEMWMEEMGGCTADIDDDFKRAFIAGVEWSEQSKWIPVAERLPEKDEQYNVAYFYIKWHIFTSGWSAEFKRWDYQNAYITHWQPLPSPPKQ